MCNLAVCNNASSRLSQTYNQLEFGEHLADNFVTYCTHDGLVTRLSFSKSFSQLCRSLALAGSTHIVKTLGMPVDLVLICTTGYDDFVYSS